MCIIMEEMTRFVNFLSDEIAKNSNTTNTVCMNTCTNNVNALKSFLLQKAAISVTKTNCAIFHLSWKSTPICTW